MKESLKRVFLRSWTPAEKTLLLLDVLLSGVLVGWLTTPLWKLVTRGSAKYGAGVEDAAWNDPEGGAAEEAEDAAWNDLEGGAAEKAEDAAWNDPEGGAAEKAEDAAENDADDRNTENREDE